VLSTTSELLASCRAAGIELAFDPDALGVPRDELAHLDAPQLARCFPRELDGRLPLDEAVLLAPVAVDATLEEAPRPPKQRWLLAGSPARRSAPQVITLALRDETGRNFEHRWDEARWLWDARAQDVPELARWGTTRELITRSSEELARGRAPAERAAYALQLVRNGRWRDALAACGVTHALDELPHRRCNHGRGIAAIVWEEALEQAMRDIAPWRFAELLRGHGHNQELRLFNFPGQTTARKYCVVLRGAATAPQLAVGHTGTSARAPAVRWRWPPDLALLVHGDRTRTQPRTNNAPLSASARATAGEDELLAQIAADPASDDARHVLADLLAERGDLRGELITLQLMRQRDAKTERRIRTLVRVHWRDWLGALGRLVERVDFERGFPVRCALGSAQTPFDAWASATTPRARAELAGVRELELADNFPLPIAREVVAAMPSLQRLAIAPELLPLIERRLAVLELRLAEPTAVGPALVGLVACPPEELRLAFTEPNTFIGATRDSLRLAGAVPIGVARYVIESPQLSLGLARERAGHLTGFDVRARSMRHLGRVLPSVLRACERAWVSRVVVLGEQPPPWAQAAIAAACSPLGVTPRYGVPG